MAIDNIFNDSAIDGIADNLFNSVSNSVSEVKAMQQRKAAENVQVVIQALKKIDADIREKYDGVTTVIEKRVSTIQDGRDGINGKDGRNGKDGQNGKPGVPGQRGLDGKNGIDGIDGQDGVSVSNAKIDFDGSLIISLSNGSELNVGEVVPSNLEKSIKVVSSGTTKATLVSETIVSASTITPTSDATNQYTVTALATPATIAIPSGTPLDNQKLIIRIKDNGTARLLTWTTSAGGYRIIGTSLPGTTIATKTVYVGCIYNATDSFWDVVSVAQQI